MTAVHYQVGAFPPKNLDWEKLITLIGQANAALARYDGALSAVPNASVLLSPLMTQEAVLSSKIEGTQTSMEEVLEFEADEKTQDVDAAKRDDINEVLNYRRALWQAVEQLEKIPLSQRVLKDAHQVLMDGVRGHGKAPGEYRRTPNWIGRPGCTIEDATFVPVSADLLPEAMSSWEKYIHADAHDPLVQLGILHAEFETIHPFLDGNGRLGRMWVPLFLYERKLILRPTFYVSAFFEAHRDEYYERLLAVSRDGDWTGWCRFFLRAITEQAESNLKKTQEILGLYENMKEQVTNLTRSQYAIFATDFLFKQPFFQSTLFVEKAGIPGPTAKRILGQLRDNGILRQVREGRGSKPALFCFGSLLNIAEGRKVF